MARLYVQLGKAGDILNLLPLLELEQRETRKKPGLIVAREFFHIIEELDYIEPHCYDGPYHEVGEACEQAKALNPDWVCTQVNCSTELVKQYVYGPAKLQTAVTTSFNKESWRVAGKLDQWDHQRPLRFPNRDPLREAALQKQWMPNLHSPNRLTEYVLCSLGGVSSPFPAAKVLRVLLKERYKSFAWRLIDLAEVKAERFYDLLGLYEHAHCLIATDSAPLHLARAVPDLPVLALTNDKPLLWYGSSWRPNHVFYCRYSDFLERIDQFVWTLDHLYDVGFKTDSKAVNRIVHVWSEYEGVSRHPEWFIEYDKTKRWLINPIEPGACGRDSALNLKDEKRLPFLKDALRMGLQRAGKDDLVCLTRPDTRFNLGITQMLLGEPISPSFAYRMDRKDGKDTFRPVADLFCAPKGWWTEQLPKIPDFVLSSDVYWCHALWALFHQQKARDLTGWIWREKK